MQEYEQAQMPDVDADGEMPNVSGASNVPNMGNIPSGAGMPSMGGNQVTKDVPPSVAQHENVIKNQNS